MGRISGSNQTSEELSGAINSTFAAASASCLAALDLDTAAFPAERSAKHWKHFASSSSFCQPHLVHTFMVQAPSSSAGTAEASMLVLPMLHSVHQASFYPVF